MYAGYKDKIWVLMLPFQFIIETTGQKSRLKASPYFFFLNQYFNTWKDSTNRHYDVFIPI